MPSPSFSPKAEPLAGLNPAQREAVLHHEGPMLVVAGAGSGKTRVLTTRIARLIQHHGVDPRRILSVTFTNKAAGEMRERIGRLLGEEPQGMWSGTFHAIGARLLRQSAALAGRSANFTIYDEDDSLGVIKRLMEKHKIAIKDFPAKMINGAISDAKNALVDAKEYQSLAADPLSRNAALVYNDLEGVMRAQNAVSFDDLLVLPVRIMEQHPERLAALQERFQFILVDEYQDTNRAQYRFINLLAGKHANVVVVGDDDQSIYGWRGADIRNILDFEKDFPAAKVVRLEENYRSSPEILELANVAISENQNRRGKTLRATRPSGERVTSVGALDERDEADWLVDEVFTRRSKDNHLLRDFAVLYRTNSQSRPLEEAMRKRGVPYRLIGAVRFYDRREIRDLMAYLKLVANPADNEAFRRAIGVPKRGLGDTTVEALADAAAGAGIPLLAAAARPDLQGAMRPAARTALAEFTKLLATLSEKARESGVDEILRDLIDGIRYIDYLKAEGPEGAERAENVRELVTSAAETVSDEGGEVGLTPLDHFLQRATLIAGVDHLDPNADAVTMMTLHNAKGLEFPVVFLTGLEDGLFPLAKAFDDPTMLEEERRLFYVGITRAERKLYLVHAEQRRRNGEMMHSKISQFLANIPDGMLEYRKTMKARSMGRNFGSSGGYGGGYGSGGRGAGASYGDRSFGTTSAANRRPGTPVSSFGSSTWSTPSAASRAAAKRVEPEDVSQDAPMYVVGARVKHKKFGSGTIAELSGNGRDAKVRIDFDDEEIGRKTLVVAQANLERGDD